jgi:hypothetical protein
MSQKTKVQERRPFRKLHFSLDDAREKIEDFRWEYTHFSAHSALNELTAALDGSGRTGSYTCFRYQLVGFQNEKWRI